MGLTTTTEPSPETVCRRTGGRPYDPGARKRVIHQ
ncbi:hypothetical protein CSUI_005448 [Cystoisospora suis]|uniref:Uncharacterized protein n=1 Tax=Cystoisospora suis TaxID=483139 RepID=A0A2C6KXI6_9APIC|nr:hypothetical protein CSUI_005448 [Cystoisospora suis]